MRQRQTELRHETPQRFLPCCLTVLIVLPGSQARESWGAATDISRFDLPRSMNGHSATATSTRTLATPNAHDQPACAAMRGVTIGPKNPPRFPPVLRMPPAAPACSPPSWTAAAQYGPS